MPYYPFITQEPSRICLVCECSEYPGAHIVDTGKAWLCDSCKTILQTIVKEKQNG